MKPATTWEEFIELYREFFPMLRYKRAQLNSDEQRQRYMLYIRDIHFYGDRLTPELLHA